LVAVLVLGSIGTVTAAERELAVTPVERSMATPLDLGSSNAETTCQVGNLNPAAWAINNFVYPPEEYKLAFDPLATCSACPIGFKVNTNHALLQTAGACQLTVWMDVEEAIYPEPGCAAPGPVLCTSLVYNANIPSAGLWNVGLPITCDCFDMGRKYLLSVHFQSTTCTPALITDAGPGELCYNWKNYGTGWYDLVEAFPDWPGQLVFFADAECCTPPVPVESKTWGAIKQIYE
jgi:hypothetical protein